MAGEHGRSGRMSGLLRVRTSREGDQVTTLELFFDLVFVFAFTQVTYVMSHGDPPLSVLQGLVVLALLWWAWTSFAWLSNQAHATEGVVRSAMIAAMGAIFLISLTIPEAYHDLEGGLYAPLVFAICYGVVRIVHLATYLAAAGSDRALARQIGVSLVAGAVPSTAILVVGAFVEDAWRVWVWLGAIAFDLLVIYITSSRGGSWRVQSAAHFAERHRLVVILALGESIVAIGVGASQEAVTTDILVGSVLAVGVSVALWWTYFGHLSEAAEALFERAEGARRAALASDSYTYLHLPIVAGIIVSALGAEEVMGHLDEASLGWLGGAALGAGPAVLLLASVFFWRRMSGRWLLARVAVGVLCAAAIPLFAVLPGLGSIAVLLGILIVLALVESRMPLFEQTAAPAESAAPSGQESP